jgi:Porin subfamily
VRSRFFDFYSNPATSYWGAFPGSDTGDGGWFVMGYTAQFGNGFSATIAAEAPRKTAIINTGTTIAALVAPGTVTAANGTLLAANLSGYGGFQAPDIVANLRVDQAWGSAQIMGALHEVNTTYYNSVLPAGVVPGFVGNAAGHPDDKLGWVVGGGIKINSPWLLSFIGGTGDYFQSQVNYTQGALRYVFQTTSPGWAFVEGNGQGLGLMADAVYGGNLSATGAATGLDLVTAWNVNAAYEHFWWNPRWRTSLYGGYAATSFGGNTNNLLCASAGAGTGFGAAALAATGCDANWNTWWVGSRTQWNVTKDFYMGVDVLYQKLESASTPTGTLNTPVLLANTIAPVAVTNPDNWSFRFRVHRDFYP